MSNYFLPLAGILFFYMNTAFIISLIQRRNDVADVAWGLGFVVLAWASFFIAGHTTTLGCLVNALVTVWGLRLSWHIYLRNKNKSEDYRYALWRQAWGKWFVLRSYLQVFLLQGVLLFIIVLPVLAINKSPSNTINTLSVTGFFVWLFGFFFEAVGDWQLSSFINNPANKGKLMTTGLWAYTRHPNYFGEVTQWWGIWLLSLTVPFGLIALISPLTITFLIVKVSGIPLLEEKMAQYSDFAAYKKRVSVFIPLPPNLFKKV